MINELHITNLAVIEDTLLNFDTNYTALIGETGAGKSLVVDSLGLVKGDKSDFSLVRDQQKKAVVTATFSLSKDFIEKHPEVKDYVQDDGSLIAKRVLLPDHTNRSYLNDEPVTLLAYRKAVSHLIDIHSQGG
jgi:DNA repair protein RecN (Recombination protein N)